MGYQHRKSSAHSQSVLPHYRVGLPELEQIVTESCGVVCAAMHSSGFFTASIAVQAVLLVCTLFH